MAKSFFDGGDTGLLRKHLYVLLSSPSLPESKAIDFCRVVLRQPNVAILKEIENVKIFITEESLDGGEESWWL